MLSKINVFIHILLLSYLVISFSDEIRAVWSGRNKVRRAVDQGRGSLLNFTRNKDTHGFHAEKHTVLTEDGYLLTLFHVLNKKKCEEGTKQSTVLLIHGLFMSSDSWLDAGPNAGLGYLLSDACFDVWIGNTRGNYNGRRHLKLDPDRDAEFWDFSTDEVGIFDIPATITYVLKETNAHKLNYIGFSQGAGAFFITCSERPEECEKVRAFIALAPATRVKGTRSNLFRVFLDGTRMAESNLRRVGIGELLPKGGWEQELLAYMCTSVSSAVCKASDFFIDTYHSGSIAEKARAAIFEHFPAGTSVRTVARYGQALWSDKYQKYDHGREGNLKFYGRPDPPPYNTSAMVTPALVMYGRDDHLVGVDDIRWLVESLTGPVKLVEVKDPLWNHLDFMYSKYNKKLIFPFVYKYLQDFSDK